MGKINNAQIKQMESNHGEIEVRRLKNGMLAYRGPWLKNEWYDSYTECLYANINFKRDREAKDRGLNRNFQTPAQQKAAEERGEAATKKQKTAELAAEMAAQSK